MSSAQLEHLIFSTRAANPESGTELNREVIAWSAGVDEGVKSAFALRADIAGSALRRRELTPIFTFSNLGPDLWLVCRAVSLGLYRKGSHQLLVHGVLLRREHLDWLDGNPFLLDHSVVRQGGFAFIDQHPDGQQELAPLHLDPEIESLAARLNGERLESLGETLHSWDEDFPALFELLLQPGRNTACIVDGLPDGRLVEWLLLHLHPHDRAEISFHTWYTHSRLVDYRLMLATEDEVALLRQQFSDLDLWPRSAFRPAEGGIGVLSRRLRRASRVGYLEAVRRYRLTYLSYRRMDPVQVSDAAAALRHDLGEALTADLADIPEILARRTAAYLTYHAQALARVWQRGVAFFEADLQRREASEWKVGPEQVGEALASVRAGSVEQRWALAVLLRSNLRDDDPEWPVHSLRAWRSLAPEDRFSELLDLFSTAEEVAHAEPHLTAFIELTVRNIRASDLVEGAPAFPYWPVYLLWLAERGRAIAAPAAHVERALDATGDGIAVAGYRHLSQVCFAAGFERFAYRILFQKELPLVDDETFGKRVRFGVGRLLGGDGQSDEVLQSFLGDARLAGEVLRAMADWLDVQDEPAAAWERWQQLVASQGEALSPDTVEACGALLARQAHSPFAVSLGESLDLLVSVVPTASREAFRDAVWSLLCRLLIESLRGEQDLARLGWLPRAVDRLLAARLDQEISVDADQALADLVFHLWVLNDDLATSGEGLAAASSGFRAELEAACVGYLELLRDDQRLGVLASGPPWGDLILDQLMQRPPEDAASDARYRAGLDLAWRRWSHERARHPGRQPAEIRIRRLLAWASQDDAHLAATQRDWMLEAVPESLHDEASTLLAGTS